MLKTYEAMFLIDPATTGKNSNTIPDYINSILDKYSVKILQQKKWAEQTLSYPIKGHKRGSYYIVYFETLAENVSKIRQECELATPILRTLILLIEPSVKSKVMSSMDAITLPSEGATSESGKS